MKSVFAVSSAIKKLGLHDWIVFTRLAAVDRTSTLVLYFEGVGVRVDLCPAE